MRAIKSRRIVFGSVLLALAACSEPALDLTSQAASGADRYIVAFNPGQASAGRAAVQAAGGQIALELPSVNALAAYLPAAAASGLSHNPNVAYVELDPKRVPLSTEIAPYGIAMVQADQVSDAAAGNRTVCIIDSGYDLGHEDLQTNNVSGYNGNLPWAVDGCGHGTHVAGTVAALANSHGVVGVLPSGKVNLFIVRVFGDNCSWTYSSSLIDAADRCRQGGANIISMSLGCSGGGGGGPFACRSNAEENAFNNLHAQGILSIAAAGNDGNTQVSYPASYASVISVAAIDENKNLASFSQRNSQVELAAPGVGVRSTVPMGTGLEGLVGVGGDAYQANPMDGSAAGTATGPLRECNLDGTCPGAAGGHVCVIQRGTHSFADKVQNCQSSGAVAAIVYNNEPGPLHGTLGGYQASIPAVGATTADGQALLGRLGQSAAVTAGPSNYEAWNGTSMATPHVAGVAALVWSHNPDWTNDQIRQALAATAEDLGAAGRDSSFGWGLVRAKAALDHLGGGSSGCDNDTDCPGGICCGGVCTTPACSTDADCDDGNECTTSTCLAAGTCSAACGDSPVADGTSCGSGGDECTEERCQAGVCTAQPIPGCEEPPPPPPPACGGNKSACSSGADCCSGNCRNGTCRGN